MHPLSGLPQRRYIELPGYVAFVGTIILAALCAGCRPTNRQLFGRYQGSFAVKRIQFKNIAQVLPPPGSVNEITVADLSPKPIYDAKTKTYNTEIVMADQLLDPDIVTQGHDRFDLILGGDLLTCMQWTGPKNPMSESALDERSADMEPRLQRVLSYLYLVVVRPANFDPPVALDEKSFKGGSADLEVFIVDLLKNKVAGSFRFSAHSASQVHYSYKADQSQKDQLQEFAYSSLFTDARQKMGPLLEKATGGHFVLED